MMETLNYAKAGVDIRVADRFVERISALVRPTLNAKVKKSIGGYASLYEIDSRQWLAASTDGVGTKLKLAMQLGDHRTVGVDLVAMSINDILCVGARPLFFLDYLATSKLDPVMGEQIIEGIVRGCREAGCALVGGETAEMPEFYAPGEYDLAGFAVGSVNPKKVLPSLKIKTGDRLIGLASTGLHSNGYSLARKLLARSGDPARARELLTPTQIYSKAVSALSEQGLVQGLAHITGSGFLNLPRISERHHYEVILPPLAERAAIYAWIYAESGLKLDELAETFNLGIGMIAVVSPKNLKKVRAHLKRVKMKHWEIGQVAKRIKTGESPTVCIQDPLLGTATLKY